MISPASVFATELLAELVARGVRDVVLCPGSRSQALALAAAQAERAEAIRLHVRLDERSAAFFALGVARETRVPAPVIVTSGTAVANLLPAALEAHEGRVPLMLITADRPGELRGVRSNQTTCQAGLFGAVARLAVDVPAPAREERGSLKSEPDRAPGEPVAGASDDLSSGLTGRESATALAAAALAAAIGSRGEEPAGPVHLNLAFREPLSGVEEGEAGAVVERFAAARRAADERRLSAAIASGTAAGDHAHECGSGGSGVCERGVCEGGADGGGVDGADGSGANGRSADEGGTYERGVYQHRGDALAVVVAGAGAGPEAEAFAHEAGLPLLAEAVSGSRFGREAITAYAALIEDPAVGGLVEQAIVFGHPTLSRQVPALLQREDVEVVVIDPYRGIDHYNPGRRAVVASAARVAPEHDSRALRRWLGAWVVPDRDLRMQRSTVHEPDLDAARATGYKERNAYARAEVASMREPVTRELLVESAWRASWPHDRLVVAASRLVRVLDGIASPRRVEVHANRGLAGIDGTVATALGIAAASQVHEEATLAAGVTRVLIGDLALLHDAGSLLLPELEERPRIQLLVGNDGGGTIFDGLEVAETADGAAFDRVMYTPARVGLAQLAAAYGWEYQRVETRVELERLFTVPVASPALVEIPLARE